MDRHQQRQQKLQGVFSEADRSLRDEKERLANVWKLPAETDKEERGPDLFAAERDRVARQQQQLSSIWDEDRAAREAELPLIVLLWNNRGYGEIKTYMVSRGIEPIGVDIYTPDFLTIARGFGCEAEKLEDPRDLPAKLKAAALRDRPTVIEIDEAAYVAGVAAES